MEVDERNENEIVIVARFEFNGPDTGDINALVNRFIQNINTLAGDTALLKVNFHIIHDEVEIGTKRLRDIGGDA